MYACLPACEGNPVEGMYVGKHKPDASIDSVIISPRPSRM